MPESIRANFQLTTITNNHDQSAARPAARPAATVAVHSAETTDSVEVVVGLFACLAHRIPGAPTAPCSLNSSMLHGIDLLSSCINSPVTVSEPFKAPQCSFR